MKKKDAEMGIKILGFTSIIFGAIVLLGALFLFAGAALFVSVPELVGAQVMFRIIGVVLVAAATLYIVAGIGALTKKRWCRVPMLFAGAMSLVNFPLKTGVGIIWLFGFEYAVKKLLA